MELTEDVIRWLEENAYAVKGKEYRFFSDFPSDQVPDRLQIPIGKKLWEKLNKNRV